MRYRAATSLVTLLSTLAFAVVLGLFVLGCGSLGDDSGSSPSSPVTSSTTTPEGSLPTFRASTTTSKPAATLTIPTSLPPTPADLILRQMTLRQKAAQTLLLAFDGQTLLPGTRDILAAGPPGGLLLLSRNVSGAEQLRSLNESLQAAAKAVKPGIGLLIAVDQEGGSVQRIHAGVPTIPSARRLAQDSDAADAATLAAGTAKGLLALGVNMNLAPVADVVSDPESFLYSRSYSGDPTVVVDFVKVVAGAFERNGLISVVKHFPGHGSATGDSHGESIVSDASQVDFAKIHFRPFKAAIAAGAEGVMVGHLIARAYDPDHPASSSSRVVGDILSEGLGFSGLIVCDDIEMAGAAGPTAEGASVRATPGEIAVNALAAGCDLIICTAAPSDQMAVVDAIVEAVRTGRLSLDRLDEAVLSMLDIKLRHNLVSP